MTTNVVVKANHGWPVKVTKLDPKTGVPLEHYPAEVVDANTERTVCCHSGMDLLIHEIQPGESEKASSLATLSPIMKHFVYHHLPAHLQEVSKPIGDLARRMDETLPDGPEKSAGLRKLLEAKDCLVRAKLG
ncbi:hypothetical protein V5F34_08475 [Xanthobacter autotrophicus]|uniref:hypothetical protein n=1 Tax=Xanthobacter autotrophicus TaxID=280 RepID=UPI003728E86A